MSVHELVEQRRSPRAFDPDHGISDEALTHLLSATAMAPSSGNRQPWRFIVGRRGEDTFDVIHGALAEGNRIWADSASALLVAMVDHGEDADAADGPDAGRAYDLGLAMGQLGLQAVHQGLITHQMGGFSKDLLRRDLQIPAHLYPMTVTAIGVAGDPTQLPDRLRQRELAPRVRKPLNEVVLGPNWDGSWAVQPG